MRDTVPRRGAQPRSDINFAALIEPVARLLLGEPEARFRKPKEWRYRGGGSLKINLEKGLWHDFEANEKGGVLKLIQRELKKTKAEAIAWLREKGLIKASQPRRNGKANGANGNANGHATPTAKSTADVLVDYDHPVAAFRYKDDSGNIYENVRYPLIRADGSPVLSSKNKPDKTFRWRHLNENGEWVNGRSDLTLVPYHKSDLPVAEGTRVFIPEGEAKADLLRSWGLTATHIPSGTENYAELFRGADVVLMPDHDDAGWKHINPIGAALHGIAKRICVLPLPGLDHKGDVQDWAAAGGTVEKLLELAEQAPA
jgi:hypothetical protein